MIMARRNGQSALDWAKNQHLHRSRDWTRDCQMFVRSAFEVPSYFGSAAAGFQGSDVRHTSWPPPPAVPVWFRGPTSFWHVALSIGDGTCWTNDYVRRGFIDRVGILTISRGWGAPYLGWTEDINEHRVYVKKPIIDVSEVIRSTRRGERIHHGKLLKRAVGAEVGQGDMSYEGHVLGANFRHQYRLLQRKWYPGSVADGIPGPTSLAKLGRRHGFITVP